MSDDEIARIVQGVCQGQAEAFVRAGAMGTRGELLVVDSLLAKLASCRRGQLLSRQRRRVFHALFLLYNREPLHGRDLLCLKCFARFRTKYYGRDGSTWEGDCEESVRYPAAVTCRVCDRARFGAYDIGLVVAVLDRTMQHGHRREGDVVRANWLKQRRLFDFDRVEVLSATDYDVETLCMQIGNDTDAYRVARHESMPCVVAAGSGLSQSAVNMLESTFGRLVADITNG